MKRLGIIIFQITVIMLWSCDKDEEITTTSLTVSLMYPETYAEAMAEGATVELINQETQAKTELVSCSEGLVAFEALIPGIYNLSASLKLSTTQAELLTGIAEEILLAGSASNIMISGSDPIDQTIQLSGGRAGDLVFKEIYYSGSRTPAGGTYFLDQFYEIYNNSTDTIYADGLILANCHPTGRVIEGWSDDPDHVYLHSVWRVPGTGEEYPIAPGESFIISQNGTNHREDPNGNPDTPYSGSIADFETFVDREDTRDVNNPDVPNMEMLHHAWGFYFLTPLAGPAMVIFRTDDFGSLARLTEPGSPSANEFVQLPIEYIIDGVEAGMNETFYAFKKLPPGIDSGMVWVSGTFVGESIRRRTARTIDGRRILQDTNNSSQDFEVVSPPTPRSFE